MTVSTTTRKQIFAGGQDDHDFSFYALDEEDIKVIATLISTGAETSLTYSTDYTVALESDNIGGTVTVSPSYSTAYTITVYRETTNKQESDYEDYNQFPADTLEQDLDRRTLVAQERSEDLDRTLKMPISYSDTVDMPIPEADYLLGWNSAGDGLENKSAPDTTVTMGTLGASNARQVLRVNTDGDEIEYIDDGIFNVKQYGAKGDGATDDTTTIQNAINAANTAGGGIVFFPQGEYITSSSLDLANKVSLIGAGANEVSMITYSGAGSAIVGTSISNVQINNLKIKCLDADANGIELQDSVRRCSIRNVDLVQNVGATATGAAIYLNVTTTWSGGLRLDTLQINAFKYGIKVLGGAGGYTAIVGTDVWLVGRSAGVLANSAGIYMDNSANGIGSYFMGGTIESYAKGVEIESGGAGALHLNVKCDFESNTSNFSIPSNWDGAIESNNGGWYIRQGVNAAANKWYKEQHIGGESYYKETYYDQKHVIYNGVGSLGTWGFYMNGSLIDGDTDAYPQGGFVGNGAHAPTTAPQTQYMFVQDRKLAFATAAATGGTWGRGSVIFNVACVSGGSMGWMCTHSGTFGAATDSSGISDGSTAVLLMSDTTGFSLYDYVDVDKGFPSTGPYKIIAIVTDTSITLDTNSDSAETGITVDTSDPVFKDMPNLAA